VEDQSIGEPSNESIAWKLNNQGVVVGEALNGQYINGFAYVRGSVTNLGTLTAGLNSHAYSINDRGQIVGVADSPSDDVCSQEAIQCDTYSYEGFLLRKRRDEGSQVFDPT